MKLSEEFISNALADDATILEKSKELSEGIYKIHFHNLNFFNQILIKIFFLRNPIE